MIVTVQVKTGARSDTIIYDQAVSVYRVSVKARAIEGAANMAIGALLAKHLDIPKTQISLKSGAKSKIKRFEY